MFERTSRSDNGNSRHVIWRWAVTSDPVSAGVTVEWTGYQETFWRQALFAKPRRRQLRYEAPASLGVLAYHRRPPDPRTCEPVASLWTPNPPVAGFLAGGSSEPVAAHCRCTTAFGAGRFRGVHG